VVGRFVRFGGEAGMHRGVAWIASIADDQKRTLPTALVLRETNY